MVLFGELIEGHRNIGLPLKRFKDQLKCSLSNIGVPHEAWTELASDRATWRATVHHAVSKFEENRRALAAEKRYKRKNPTINAEPSHHCVKCGRACFSRIGLFNVHNVPV